MSRYVRLVRFSYLILIGCFVTLEAWSIQAPHPCTIDDHGQFCCFGSRRISRWQSSRPCSANARPQTARRWATRRRPESREPLRPVAARQKPQATADAGESCRSKLPARARCTSTCPRSLSISVFRAFLGENARSAREVGDPAWDRYWPGLLAEVDDALMWSSTGPGTVPVQDGARRGRGVARGRGGSRVTVGVQAGRRCWGWCCR